MKKYVVVIVVSALFIGGCAVEVVESVPEETVVAKTNAPYEDAVWIENEYTWNGETYVVVPAHWEKSKGTWVKGRWERTGKGYRWISGEWR